MDATDALRSYFGTLGKNERPSPTKAVQWLRDVGVMDFGDHFLIGTEGYPGSHYATFPRAFVKPFVECLTPLKVCRVCGEPSRRIVETEQHGHTPNGDAVAKGRKKESPVYEVRTTTTTTTGWTDCGHDDYRTGVTLDPFAGSGTTLEVATGHGRDAIGIDIDERNAELAYERIGGLFLTIEHFSQEPAA